MNVACGGFASVSADNIETYCTDGYLVIENAVSAWLGWGAWCDWVRAGVTVRCCAQGALATRTHTHTHTHTHGSTQRCMVRSNSVSFDLATTLLTCAGLPAFGFRMHLFTVYPRHGE